MINPPGDGVGCRVEHQSTYRGMTLYDLRRLEWCGALPPTVLLKMEFLYKNFINSKTGNGLCLR